MCICFAFQTGRVYNDDGQGSGEIQRHAAERADVEHQHEQQRAAQGQAGDTSRVELLIEKMQNEMAELLVELMDIILHCLDPSQLKNKGLQEVFPAVCRFNQVSHCPATRRISVGSHVGTLTIYELRQGKCTTITAHLAAVTALAFSPDGKFLVSYACGENKLSFWQTSTEFSKEKIVLPQQHT
ncbi:hypothetical protein NQ318_017067 [Aromia moschata]|uniref:WD repeat-containing protein 7 n=1 Tax=Aromia moschata TaxID=1265417 RepID=A0AAV8X4C4_9CUCU|nr:hypothetical protein NQ318_017067 [Aromia moschata]